MTFSSSSVSHLHRLRGLQQMRSHKMRKKQGERAINSVLGFSTVAMDFEEVDHEGSSASVDVADGDQAESPDLKLRSLLDPVLWRTLPKELLLLILARLPVPAIIRLRSLSGGWKRELGTVDSGINLACDEASPPMLAVITPSSLDGPRTDFLVTICDLSKHRLPYSYTVHLRNPGGFENGWMTMGGIDGGLTCFVSTWRPSKANPQCIVTMNLLTRDRHELPPLRCSYSVPPTMVHLKVDSETKSYKVVVVGKLVKDRRSVETYDSGTKKWTREAPPGGSLFGAAYEWKYCKIFNYFNYTKGIRTPCVYDFAERQLKLCSEMNPFDGYSARRCALGKDRCMFVLEHKQEPRNPAEVEMLEQNYYVQPVYYITEFYLTNDARDWVRGKSSVCTAFEGDEVQAQLLDYERLNACDGFLMASVGSRFWFLDLSTGEWTDRPERLEGHDYHSGTSICRALWNVFP